MKTALIAINFVLVWTAAAQDWSGGVARKVAEIESQAVRQNAQIRVDALLTAAVMVKDTHADLSQRLTARAVADLRKNPSIETTPDIAFHLATLKPEEAERLLLSTHDREAAYNSLILSALQKGGPVSAAAVTRTALAGGVSGLPITVTVVRQLSRRDADAASALFKELVKAFPWKTAKAGNYLWLLNCAVDVAAKDPATVAEMAARIVSAVESADEDLGLDRRISALTQVPRLYPPPVRGGLGLNTYTARDLVLFQAAAFLRVLDPARFEARSRAFDRWAGQMEIIGTWKPADLRLITSPITAFELKSEPVPDDSRRRPATSVEEAVSLIEQTFMPFTRVHLLVRQFGRPDLTPDQDTLVASRAIAALAGLPDGLDRVRIAESVFSEVRDYPVAQPVREEAAKMFADALSKAGTESELARTSRQRGQPGSVVDIADQLARIARCFPDYRGGPPVLDLYRNLQSLSNLMGERIDFEVTGLDGKARKLSDYRGKVVLLNFWATWCPPCQREMPTLDALHKNWNDKDLVVLPITDEEAKVVSAFAASKGGYSMPLLLDDGGKVHDRFGTSGIPYTIIINREGKIVEQFYGMRSEAEYLKDLRSAGL